MIKSITISIFLTLMVISGYSRVWTLSDSKLRVRFDDQTVLLSRLTFGDTDFSFEGKTINAKGYLIN